MFSFYKKMFVSFLRIELDSTNYQNADGTQDNLNLRDLNSDSSIRERLSEIQQILDRMEDDNWSWTGSTTKEEVIKKWLGDKYLEIEDNPKNRGKLDTLLVQLLEKMNGNDFDKSLIIEAVISALDSFKAEISPLISDGEDEDVVNSRLGMNEGRLSYFRDDEVSKVEERLKSKKKEALSEFSVPNSPTLNPLHDSINLSSLKSSYETALAGLESHKDVRGMENKIDALVKAFRDFESGVAEAKKNHETAIASANAEKDKAAPSYDPKIKTPELTSLEVAFNQAKAGLENAITSGKTTEIITSTKDLAEARKAFEKKISQLDTELAELKTKLEAEIKGLTELYESIRSLQENPYSQFGDLIIKLDEFVSLNLDQLNLVELGDKNKDLSDLVASLYLMHLLQESFNTDKLNSLLTDLNLLIGTSFEVRVKPLISRVNSTKTMDVTTIQGLADQTKEAYEISTELNSLTAEILSSLSESIANELKLTLNPSDDADLQSFKEAYEQARADLETYNGDLTSLNDVNGASEALERAKEARLIYEAALEILGQRQQLESVRSQDISNLGDKNLERLLDTLRELLSRPLPTTLDELSTLKDETERVSTEFNQKLKELSTQRTKAVEEAGEELASPTVGKKPEGEEAKRLYDEVADLRVQLSRGLSTLAIKDLQELTIKLREVMGAYKKYQEAKSKYDTLNLNGYSDYGNQSLRDAIEAFNNKRGSYSDSMDTAALTSLNSELSGLKSAVDALNTTEKNRNQELSRKAGRLLQLGLDNDSAYRVLIQRLEKTGDNDPLDSAISDFIKSINEQLSKYNITVNDNIEFIFLGEELNGTTLDQIISSQKDIIISRNHDILNAFTGLGRIEEDGYKYSFESGQMVMRDSKMAKVGYFTVSVIGENGVFSNKENISLTTIALNNPSDLRQAIIDKFQFRRESMYKQKEQTSILENNYSGLTIGKKEALLAMGVSTQVVEQLTPENGFRVLEDKVYYRGFHATVGNQENNDMFGSNDTGEKTYGEIGSLSALSVTAFGKWELSKATTIFQWSRAIDEKLALRISDRAKKNGREVESSEILTMFELASEIAKKYGLPEAEFIRHIDKENGQWNPDAKNGKTIRGLGQMKKSTWDLMVKYANDNFDSGKNRTFDRNKPKDQLELSAVYLIYIMKDKGVPLSIAKAFYNTGENFKYNSDSKAPSSYVSGNGVIVSKIPDKLRTDGVSKKEYFIGAIAYYNDINWTEAVGLYEANMTGVLRRVGDSFARVGEAVISGVSTVGSGVVEVGEAVSSGVTAASSGVVVAGKKVGEVVSSGVTASSSGVVAAGEKVGEVVSGAVEAVESDFNKYTFELIMDKLDANSTLTKEEREAAIKWLDEKGIIVYSPEEVRKFRTALGLSDKDPTTTNGVSLEKGYMDKLTDMKRGKKKIGTYEVNGEKRDILVVYRSDANEDLGESNYSIDMSGMPWHKSSVRIDAPLSEENLKVAIKRFIALM